jgi:hypothetical protein
MEYGPRALGNRSILYHAKEPAVNQWLNQRLGRTEFMPFAPATLFEKRHDCYRNIDGGEYAAQFMTLTFDCTESMKRDSPAAVHVDGTARPQLVSATSNPVFTAFSSTTTGIPSLINTSFNMHEEPIVCSPDDAIRAFCKPGHSRSATSSRTLPGGNGLHDEGSGISGSERRPPPWRSTARQAAATEGGRECRTWFDTGGYPLAAIDACLTRASLMPRSRDGRGRRPFWSTEANPPRRSRLFGCCGRRAQLRARPARRSSGPTPDS